MTQEEWFTQQLEALEAHVRAERQRRHEEMRREALRALITRSLPELLGEVRQDDPEQDARCEPVAPRMHYREPGAAPVLSRPSALPPVQLRLHVGRAAVRAPRCSDTSETGKSSGRSSALNDRQVTTAHVC
jgi:hypothetical protein